MILRANGWASGLNHLGELISPPTVSACLPPAILHMKPTVIYVRVGLRIPVEYTAVGQPLFVPSVNPKTLLSCTGVGSAIDITSLERAGVYRAVVIEVTYHLRMRNGKEYWLTDALLEEGHHGGGWFIECRLNPVYDRPITPEQFQKRLDQEAEDWAMEHLD